MAGAPSRSRIGVAAERERPVAPTGLDDVVVIDELAGEAAFLPGSPTSSAIVMCTGRPRTPPSAFNHCCQATSAAQLGVAAAADQP